MPVLMFFTIFGLVVLTAIVFVTWMLVRIVMWVIGAVFGFGDKPQHVGGLRHDVGTTSVCARPNCRAVNPAQARFCHRCGNAIAIGRGGSHALQMRYVA